MAQFNWKWYHSLKDRHEELFGGGVIPSKSGIYKWSREKENGLKCEYIGQAKNLFNRHFQYYCIQCGMRPFKKPRPIELSLMKHKDWEFSVIDLCEEQDLNAKEQFFINKSKLQPNTQNYNVIFGNSEQTKAVGPTKLLKDYKKRLQKLLSNVKVSCDEKRLDEGITISYHLNKDGSGNKKSLDSLSELIQEIKHLIEE